MSCERAKADVRCKSPYSRTGTTYTDRFKTGAQFETLQTKRSLRKQVCDRCNEIHEDVFQNMMSQIDTGNVDTVEKEISDYFRSQKMEYDSLITFRDTNLRDTVSSSPILTGEQQKRLYELMKFYDPSRYEQEEKQATAYFRLKEGYTSESVSPQIFLKWQRMFEPVPYSFNSETYLREMETTERKRYEDLKFVVQFSEPTPSEWYEFLDLSCKYDPTACSMVSNEIAQKQALENKIKRNERLSVSEEEELDRLIQLYGVDTQGLEKELDDLSAQRVAKESGLDQLNFVGGKTKKKKSRRMSKKRSAKRSKRINKYASRREKL